MREEGKKRENTCSGLNVKRNKILVLYRYVSSGFFYISFFFFTDTDYIKITETVPAIGKHQLAVLFFFFFFVFVVSLALIVEFVQNLWRNSVQHFLWIYSQQRPSLIKDSNTVLSS